jgi:hypothetical protein
LLAQRYGETAIPHGRLPASTLAVTRPACRSTMETSSELPLAVKWRSRSEGPQMRIHGIGEQLDLLGRVMEKDKD